MKMAKMKILYVVVALLLFSASSAQSRFFPDVSKRPVWYVYAMDLIVCAAKGCYPYKQVYRVSIEPTDTQPTNGDSTYALYFEVVSANYDFTYTQKTNSGTITVGADEKVFFSWPDTQFNGFLDSRGILMYENNLIVGDSIDPGYWLKYVNTVVHRYTAFNLNGYDNVVIGGINRERWMLSPTRVEDELNGKYYYNSTQVDVPIDSTIHLIEGIGSNQGPIYFGGQMAQVRQLICYEELGDTIYRLVPGSPCDLALRDISDNPDMDVSDRIKILPNPTSRYLNVVMLQGEWEYKIVNVLGQLVAEGTLNPQRYQIDLDLVNGTYLIELKESYGEGYTLKRFVVQN